MPRPRRNACSAHEPRRPPSQADTVVVQEWHFSPFLARPLHERMGAFTTYDRKGRANVSWPPRPWAAGGSPGVPLAAFSIDVKSPTGPRCASLSGLTIALTHVI